MTLPSPPTSEDSSVEGFDPGVARARGVEVADPVATKSQLVRLILSVTPATMAINFVWGAISNVIMALHIQQVLGESDKIANLAIVTTVGGIVSMISSPICGLVSDRTRSRFGRRSPWIVGGAIIGALSLIAMSFSGTLWQFAITWSCVIVGYNFAQAALTAVMPDRVPRAARGTFSALIGLGAMGGSLISQIIAARLASNLTLGYVGFAGVTLLILVLFVVLNKDKPSTDVVIQKYRWRDVLRTYWINPLHHPDFAWAFGTRLLLYTGYSVVFGYQLYILQDYIGLGEDAVGLVSVMSLVAICGLLPMALLGGRLSDRFRRRKPFVMIASLLIAVAMIIPMFSPTVAGMIVMMAIAGMGYGCYQAVDNALISEVLPSQASFGKDLGVVNLAAAIPQIIGPALAGVLVIWGGYLTLFPAGAICAVLAALGVLKIRSVR